MFGIFWSTDFPRSYCDEAKKREKETEKERRKDTLLSSKEYSSRFRSFVQEMCVGQGGKKYVTLTTQCVHSDYDFSPLYRITSSIRHDVYLFCLIFVSCTINFGR